MENETIDLCPEGDGKFTYTQMTLQEDHFCRLVAEPKIIGRIAEIRLGIQRKNDAKWDANRESGTTTKNSIF